NGPLESRRGFNGSAKIIQHVAQIVPRISKRAAQLKSLAVGTLRLTQPVLLVLQQPEIKVHTGIVRLQAGGEAKRILCEVRLPRHQKRLPFDQPAVSFIRPPRRQSLADFARIIKSARLKAQRSTKMQRLEWRLRLGQQFA